MVFKRASIGFKAICALMVITFTSVVLLSDIFKVKSIEAAMLGLPAPTQMLELSANYSTPMLQGLKLDIENPLNIDFIINRADQDDVSQEEASKLISYFLAALTIPESDLWVNLSPYEQDRIATDELSITDLGKDLLSQDYILKQLSASLTNPDTQIGQAYWSMENRNLKNEIRNTFNKIWIVPDQASVYENNNIALITESTMKVLTEQDYVAKQHNQFKIQNSRFKNNNKVKETIKEILIPEITKDVNSGENFAPLRQMYSAMILGVWFKNKMKNTFFKHYINQGKVDGIDINDKNAKDKIFNLYVDAFKKGVYNTIKKEINPQTGKKVKRQYFSGGWGWNDTKVKRASGSAVIAVIEKNADKLLFASSSLESSEPSNLVTYLDEIDKKIEEVDNAGSEHFLMAKALYRLWTFIKLNADISSLFDVDIVPVIEIIYDYEGADLFVVKDVLLNRIRAIRKILEYRDAETSTLSQANFHYDVIEEVASRFDTAIVGLYKTPVSLYENLNDLLGNDFDLVDLISSSSVFGLSKTEQIVLARKYLAKDQYAKSDFRSRNPKIISDVNKGIELIAKNNVKRIDGFVKSFAVEKDNIIKLNESGELSTVVINALKSNSPKKRIRIINNIVHIYTNMMFERESNALSRNFIVNEVLVKHMQWDQSPKVQEAAKNLLIQLNEDPKKLIEELTQKRSNGAGSAIIQSSANEINSSTKRLLTYTSFSALLFLSILNSYGQNIQSIIEGRELNYFSGTKPNELNEFMSSFDGEIEVVKDDELLVRYIKGARREKTYRMLFSTEVIYSNEYWQKYNYDFEDYFSEEELAQPNMDAAISYYRLNPHTTKKKHKEIRRTIRKEKKVQANSALINVFNKNKNDKLIIDHSVQSSSSLFTPKAVATFRKDFKETFTKEFGYSEKEAKQILKFLEDQKIYDIFLNREYKPAFQKYEVLNKFLEDVVDVRFAVPGTANVAKQLSMRKDNEPIALNTLGLSQLYYALSHLVELTGSIVRTKSRYTVIFNASPGYNVVDFREDKFEVLPLQTLLSEINGVKHISQEYINKNKALHPYSEFAVLDNKDIEESKRFDDFLASIQNKIESTHDYQGALDIIIEFLPYYKPYAKSQFYGLAAEAYMAMGDADAMRKAHADMRDAIAEMDSLDISSAIVDDFQKSELMDFALDAEYNPSLAKDPYSAAKIKKGVQYLAEHHIKHLETINRYLDSDESSVRRMFIVLDYFSQNNRLLRKFDYALKINFAPKRIYVLETLVRVYKQLINNEMDKQKVLELLDYQATTDTDLAVRMKADELYNEISSSITESPVELTKLDTVISDINKKIAYKYIVDNIDFMNFADDVSESEKLDLIYAQLVEVFSDDLTVLFTILAKQLMREIDNNDFTDAERAKVDIVVKHTLKVLTGVMHTYTVKYSPDAKDHVGMGRIALGDTNGTETEVIIDRFKEIMRGSEKDLRSPKVLQKWFLVAFWHDIGKALEYFTSDKRFHDQTSVELLKKLGLIDIFNESYGLSSDDVKEITLLIKTHLSLGGHAIAAPTVYDLKPVLDDNEFKNYFGMDTIDTDKLREFLSKASLFWAFDAAGNTPTGLVEARPFEYMVDMFNLLLDGLEAEPYWYILYANLDKVAYQINKKRIGRSITAWLEGDFSKDIDIANKFFEHGEQNIDKLFSNADWVYFKQNSPYIQWWYYIWQITMIDNKTNGKYETDKAWDNLVKGTVLYTKASRLLGASNRSNKPSVDTRITLSDGSMLSFPQRYPASAVINRILNMAVDVKLIEDSVYFVDRDGIVLDNAYIRYGANTESVEIVITEDISSSSLKHITDDKVGGIDMQGLDIMVDPASSAIEFKNFNFENFKGFSFKITKLSKIDSKSLLAELSV